VLIALGGRSVNIDAIMAAVWPHEGAAARATLDVTLMRLRKLLNHADVLTLSDGKLTLNDQVCWVDCWTFERAVAKLDADAQSDAIANVSSFYRGAFLAREQDIPCIVNAVIGWRRNFNAWCFGREARGDEAGLEGGGAHVSAWLGTGQHP